MHSRCKFEFHFNTPFGGKLIMLTFCDLQETAVRAIIGLPFVVVEQVIPVEKRKTCSEFSKKPGYQPGFLVSAIRYLHVKTLCEWYVSA